MLVATLNGCGKSPDETPIANGTVGGGGGGTTSPLKASRDMIKLAAAQAKLTIVTFLNEEEIRFVLHSSGMSAEWKTLNPKLFNSSNDIFKVIEKISIEVRADAPCYDSSGDVVEGSIFSNYSDSICISSLLLAQKLDVYNYEYETAALILHELSHLLGATESEAVSVQVSYIQNMRANSYSRVRTLQQQYYSDLSAIKLDLDQFSLDMGSYPPTNLPTCKFNPKINWKLWDWEHDVAAQGNFYALRASDFEVLQNQIIRLSMLADYICLNDPVQIKSGNATYSKKRFDTGFGLDQQIEIQDYAIRLGVYKFVNRLQSDISKKPQDATDVFWELMKVRGSFSVLVEKVLKLAPYSKDTFFNLR